MVRCLLIEPNPESALNQEAGKLLLEDYEDFARRARMMTRIHAKPKKAEVAAGKKKSDESSDACAKEVKESGSSSPIKKPKPLDGNSSSGANSSSSSANASASAPAAAAKKKAAAVKTSLKRL